MTVGYTFIIGITSCVWTPYRVRLAREDKGNVNVTVGWQVMKNGIRQKAIESIMNTGSKTKTHRHDES